MNSTFTTNILLSEESASQCIVEIQRISSLLNLQSSSDKLGLFFTKNAPIFPQIYGPSANFTGVQKVK